MSIYSEIKAIYRAHKTTYQNIKKTKEKIEEKYNFIKNGLFSDDWEHWDDHYFRELEPNPFKKTFENYLEARKNYKEAYKTFKDSTCLVINEEYFKHELVLFNEQKEAERIMLEAKAKAQICVDLMKTYQPFIDKKNFFEVLINKQEKELKKAKISLKDSIETCHEFRKNQNEIIKNHVEIFKEKILNSKITQKLLKDIKGKNSLTNMGLREAIEIFEEAKTLKDCKVFCEKIMEIIPVQEKKGSFFFEDTKQHFLKRVKSESEQLNENTKESLKELKEEYQEKISLDNWTLRLKETKGLVFAG